jgi:hypothetical protein
VGTAGLTVRDGLQAGGNYSYKVIARNANGASQATGTFEVPTNSSRLFVTRFPTNVTANSADLHGSYPSSWNPYIGLRTYEYHTDPVRNYTLSFYWARNSDPKGQITGYPGNDLAAEANQYGQVIDLYESSLPTWSGKAVDGFWDQNLGCTPPPAFAQLPAGTSATLPPGQCAGPNAPANSNTGASAHLSGLQPGTDYWYRVDIYLAADALTNLNTKIWSYNGAENVIQFTTAATSAGSPKVTSHGIVVSLGCGGKGACAGQAQVVSGNVPKVSGPLAAKLKRGTALAKAKYKLRHGKHKRILLRFTKAGRKAFLSRKKRLAKVTATLLIKERKGHRTIKTGRSVRLRQVRVRKGHH